MNARVWLGAGALAAGVVALAGVGAAAQGRQPLERAPARTTLAGIPVEGQTAEEVRALADELATRLLALPLSVRYGANTERMTPTALGAACDPAAAALAVLTPPRPDGPLEGLAERFTGPPPRDVALPVRFEAVAVRKALARFAGRIGTGPREPRLTTVGGKLQVLPGSIGRELDADAMAAALEKTLAGTQLRAAVAQSLGGDESRAAWLSGRKPVDVPALTRPAPSRITAEHLQAITAPLADFSTSLGGSSRNRTENIRIACRAIDGKVLLPGDVFSYNEVVGPRVRSAGYTDAPVIVNGEMESGLAGGICQVSSTLYNVALLADMGIVARRRHAFPVSYIAAGRDATVVDGAIDFRFRNTLKHPVAVDAKVVENRVRFRIHGHPDDRREVQILSSGVRSTGARVKEVPDPKLPKGKRVTEKRAKSGKSVTITRVVKKDGAEVRREVVSRDYYPPQTGIVRVGTREEPKPVPALGEPPPATPTPAPGPRPAVVPLTPPAP